MIYYIADTHFGDERVMRLAQRPFTSVNQMNNYLCGKWNAKVGGDDTVYVWEILPSTMPPRKKFFRC